MSANTTASNPGASAVTVDQQTGWNSFTGKQFRYVWTIHNYVNSCTLSSKLSIESPTFTDDLHFCKWYLKFYPSEEDNRLPHVKLIGPLELAQDNKFADLIYSIELLDRNACAFLPRGVSVPGCMQVSRQNSNIDFAPEINFGGKLSIYLKTLLGDGNTLKFVARIWNTDSQARGSGAKGQTQALKPASTLAPNLKSLLMDTTYADLDIIIGRRKFAGHKCILAARSDVFRTMFRTPMSEAASNCVTIRGFSLEVAKGMLEYIYADQTEIKPEFATEFLRIGDMYNLEGLKHEAGVVLGANLAVTNVVEAFKYSVLYKNEMLKSTTTEFIKRNKMALATDPDLEELAKTNLKDVLKLFAST